MHLRRLVVIAIALFAFTVLMAMEALADQLKRGGTLRVAYGNAISHHDFHTAPGYEMMWVAMNVGCGLVNVTPDGKFVGDAAESRRSLSIDTEQEPYLCGRVSSEPCPRYDRMEAGCKRSDQSSYRR